MVQEAHIDQGQRLFQAGGDRAIRVAGLVVGYWLFLELVYVVVFMWVVSF